MSDSTEVVIVAAMEREVEPLIQGWTMILSHSRRVFEKGKVVVIVGGIGPKFAAEATEGILSFREPEVIVSVGLAGALQPTMSVGTVLVPTKVLRQESQQTFTIDGGEGTLITSARIANADEKRQMAARFGAQAIDMEAAAVAEVAQRRGLKFAAVKAISDDLDFPMPPIGNFIGDGGEFRTGRFLAHAAFRPRTWPVLNQLRRNAERATSALCAVLAKIESAADVDSLLQSWSQKAS